MSFGWEEASKLQVTSWKWMSCHSVSTMALPMMGVGRLQATVDANIGTWRLLHPRVWGWTSAPCEALKVRYGIKAQNRLFVSLWHEHVSTSWCRYHGCRACSSESGQEDRAMSLQVAGQRGPSWESPAHREPFRSAALKAACGELDPHWGQCGFTDMFLGILAPIHILSIKGDTGNNVQLNHSSICTGIMVA